MKINKCKCCGSERLQVLIDFGMQPVAHNLLDDKEQEDSYMHPLCLHYCEECGFIQINDPISPELLYTKYNYCFSAWKRQPHISDEINILNKYINNKEIKILEIGCNDGVFLGPLRKAGFKNIVGVEANSYAAKEASSGGFDILNFMFDKQSAARMRKQYDYFDMIIMRQVLEHIPDLDSFFEALDLLLNGEKLLFIEVPDFANALKYGDCSTIWEEHPNYFTYEVLRLMLNSKGYTIVDKASYDFSGGAICVLARKTNNEETRDTKKKFLAQYQSFSGIVNDYGLKLKSAIKQLRENGKTIFLYGTGSRACTLVNGLGVGNEIDYAIDDQKEKQEHYMPGCHLPIISLDKAIEVGVENGVVLLAVNHENEELVSEKIISLAKEGNVKIVSLFAPNNIFQEIDKLYE